MPVLDLGSLKIEVKVLNDDEGFKKTQEDSKKTQKTLEKVGESLSKLGAGMTTFVTLPLLAAGTAAVKLATDMAETVSKIGVVFGDNATAIDQWAGGAIKNMGLARQTAMDAAATFGDMGAGMGIADDASLKMSTSLVQLAADMASFKNISVDRALVALNGVYTGETEALKGLGIVMTQANLEQFALNEGIQTQISEMSQAELVTLRYQYVMSVTSAAQGDFARTGGGVANQTRMITENLKELGAQAGEVLLPMVNKVVVALNDFLENLQNIPESQREAAVTTALVVAAIGPLIMMIGKAIQAYNALKAAIMAARAAEAAAGAAGAAAAGPAGWIALAAAAVIALAAVITTQAIAAYKAFYEESIKLEESTKNALKSVQDAGATYQESSDKTLAAAAAAEQYLNRLDELNGVTSLTVAQQAEYKTIVNTLNGLIPDLSLKIDEQTGKLTTGTGAIRDQIAAWRDLAIAQAAQAYLTEITNAYTEALIAQAMAEQDLAEMQAQRNDLEAKRLKFAQDLEAITGKTIGQLQEEIGPDLHVYDTLTGVAKELYQAYLDAGVAISVLDLKIIKLSETLKENDTAVAAIAEQMGKTEEAVRAIMERVSDGTATKEEIKELGEAFEELGYSVDEVSNIIASFSGIAQDMFDKLEMKSKTSMDRMIKNLKYNQEALLNWSSNLKKLRELGIDSGFLDYLESLGPTYANSIQTMIDATPEKLAELVAAWQEGIPTAVETAENLGYSLAAGIAAGIKSGATEVNNAVVYVLNGALFQGQQTMEIASPSKRMKRELGSPLPAGVAQGVEEGMPDVLQKMTDGLDGITLGASEKIRQLWKWPAGNGRPTPEPAHAAAPQLALAGGITQNVSITSPTPLAPSRIARDSKNALRRMLWDVM